jgi:hypothetical protein
MSMFMSLPAGGQPRTETRKRKKWVRFATLALARSFSSLKRDQEALLEAVAVDVAIVDDVCTLKITRRTAT